MDEAKALEAAKVSCARMVKHFRNEALEVSELGYEWAVFSDPILLIHENGERLTVGDFLYGNLMIMWKLVSDLSDFTGLTEDQVLQDVGMAIAVKQQMIEEPGE